MFDNLYTTKMSMDQKNLQNRFSKIRSKNGRISKTVALAIFAVILLVMLFVSFIIAASVPHKDYTMSRAEFIDYANRPIGSVMAELDYMDEDKLVFHYGKGFFILKRYSLELDHMLKSELDFVINLEKLNLSYHQQGSHVLDVKIDKSGEYAYLSNVGAQDEIRDFEEYIINLNTGAVEKGKMPENAEIFAGLKETFTTVENPVGWYSDNCIVDGNKTYYLSSETGTVVGIELVETDSENGKNETIPVFGGNVTLQTDDIREFAPEDIRGLTNVELVVGSIQYPLTDPGKLSQIEKMFSEATEIGGATKCPFVVELVFATQRGKRGKVTLAADSCAVYESRGRYYDYSKGDNSELYGYFGLDTESLLEMLRRKRSELYQKTEDFLQQEFHRVYDWCYDIQELKISHWEENGNEATCFYTMTYLYYNRNPDKLEYIQKAKKSGPEYYQRLYDDYLALKKSNYEFKVVLKDGEIELYSNVSPKGTQWVRTKIDEYILGNE